MNNNSNTTMFSLPAEMQNKVSASIKLAAEAMEEKGYDPMNQFVGYLLSGDPTYITNHNGARSIISRLDRDEVIEEIVRVYLKALKEE